MPTTISTDLNVFNADHPVRSLPDTMSKIWALGLSLLEVVAMATDLAELVQIEPIHPAEAIPRSAEPLACLACRRRSVVVLLNLLQARFLSGELQGQRAAFLVRERAHLGIAIAGKFGGGTRQRRVGEHAKPDLRQGERGVRTRHDVTGERR